MTATDVDLAALTPDEAHVARSAVASHRRNLRRTQAQAAFFAAVEARFNERPNALLICPGSDVPRLAFGVGRFRVDEPMPDDLAELYRAWKSA